MTNFPELSNEFFEDPKTGDHIYLRIDGGAYRVSAETLAKLAIQEKSDEVQNKLGIKGVSDNYPPDQA